MSSTYSFKYIVIIMFIIAGKNSFTYECIIGSNNNEIGLSPGTLLDI